MNDAVAAALTQYLSARGNPPGAGEGVTIARTVTNELDSARFDPLLVRTVARNAGKVLEGLASKIDAMVCWLFRSFVVYSIQLNAMNSSYAILRRRRSSDPTQHLRRRSTRN